LRVSGRATPGAGRVALHYSALSAHDNAVKRDTTPKERERKICEMCAQESERANKEARWMLRCVSHTKLDYDASGS
jgi:hypothetical protein